MVTFGQRFKQLRIEKEKTQDELAKDFNTTKSSISKYENDDQMPKDLNFVCKYFGVSSDYMLGISDIRNIKETNEYRTKESFVNELLTLLVKQGKIEKFSDLTEHQRQMIELAISQQIEEINKSRD